MYNVPSAGRAVPVGGAYNGMKGPVWLPISTTVEAGTAVGAQAVEY